MGLVQEKERLRVGHGCLRSRDFRGDRIQPGCRRRNGAGDLGAGPSGYGAFFTADCDHSFTDGQCLPGQSERSAGVAFGWRNPGQYWRQGRVVAKRTLAGWALCPDTFDLERHFLRSASTVVCMSRCIGSTEEVAV